MNTNKFFQIAKENNIEVSELNLSKATSFEFSIFKKEIDSYKLSSSSKIKARGIFNGKLGFASTEKDDKNTISFLINNIKDSAKFIEKDEKPIIFKGSEKYVKRNLFNKDLEAWDTQDKINKMFELEKICQEMDKRVTDVEISYSEETSERVLTNSYGLNLKRKSNYYVVYCSIVVREGEEVKTNYDIILESDPSKLNIQEIAKKAVDGAISLLHGVDPKNGKNKVVLNNESVSSLLSVVLSNLSAEEIQKNTSLYIGKLNTPIVSNKLTVSEMPLKKNCFFTNFDDEGVATQNKKVIEKGVLKTYFYNLETAEKDNVETTGNGYSAGSKIGIDFVNIEVKPGRLSEEELFEKIQNGVYITSLQGLHAGLNAKSGDFSLQAEGYLIKDGKKVAPLGMFTAGGNVFEMFNNIIAVGNNSKLLLNSTNTPSIAFRGVKISS